MCLFKCSTIDHFILVLSSEKDRSFMVKINLGVIALLFFLALIEWIIDCVNTVGEATITLIDNPEADLSAKYSAALEFIFHRNAIQAILYSYMVSSN